MFEGPAKMLKAPVRFGIVTDSCGQGGPSDFCRGRQHFGGVRHKARQLFKGPKKRTQLRQTQRLCPPDFGGFAERELGA